MFGESLWLINTLDHIKYFQLHVFYSKINTHSTKWIFNSIITSTRSVHTNDEWIVINLSRVQISKCFLIMYCWLFMDTHFIDNDQPKHSNTSNKIINVSLMNLEIYTIYIFSNKILMNIFINILTLIVSYLTRKS